MATKGSLSAASPPSGVMSCLDGAASCLPPSVVMRSLKSLDGAASYLPQSGGDIDYSHHRFSLYSSKKEPISHGHLQNEEPVSNFYMELLKELMNGFLGPAFFWEGV